MKRAIAMKCNQEQWDAIKWKLVGLRKKRCDEFEFFSYLINNSAGCLNVINNLESDYKSDNSREVHETWNEQVFLEACGIETEKIFKGSELQWFNTDEEKWMDCCHKYRLKPDYSKEIEELERQIEKTSKMEITREEYARILRLDPNFFSLELKQWYKGDFGEEGVLIFFDSLNEKGDIKGYGVNSSGWYDNRQNNYYHYGKLSDTNDWIKATEQEVLEVLIKEAKRRGFKHGCSWGRMTAYDGESYYLKNNTLTLQNGNILKDGIWEKTNNY